MKKKLIFSLLVLQSLGILIAQNCLPEGIIFYTQTEIDDFQTDYPGCTEIDGNVFISGDNMTNLNGLNILQSVGGNLLVEFNPQLTTLEGLDSLNRVEGSLLINLNHALTSLDGIEKLSFIGGSFGISNKSDNI